jgi:ABC-type sulfate transport system permease component
VSSSVHSAVLTGARPRRQRGRDPFLWLAVASSAVIVAFILVPLVEMMTQPTLASLKETLMDRDVVRSIRLSIVTSGSAALIALVFGTPWPTCWPGAASRARRSWKASSTCPS